MEGNIRLPPDIQSVFWQSTETFVTTVQGKPVRFRFLPLFRISDENQLAIKKILTSFKFLYGLTLESERVKGLQLGKSFLKMIENSSQLYNRYFAFLI